MFATAFFACSKDKFKTEPQVEIKSLGPDEVNKGEIITFRAIVRDKEGDLQGNVKLVRKRFTGNVQISVDTLPYSIANFGFPDKSVIEVTAQFSYGELRDGYIFANLENQDREFSVGIIVEDKAGHESEYKESDKILLKKL